MHIVGCQVIIFINIVLFCLKIFLRGFLNKKSLIKEEGKDKESTQ